MVTSEQWRARGEWLLQRHGRTQPWQRAYVGGTFDLLHRGHLELFALIRHVARETVVALNTDEFVARFKRPEGPVMPLADRMAVVGSLRTVSRVIVNFGDEDSRPAIEAAQPDVIVHGDDWQPEAYYRQMQFSAEWLQERGIALVHVPYSTTTSTSQILASYAARLAAVVQTR